MTDQIKDWLAKFFPHLLTVAKRHTNSDDLASDVVNDVIIGILSRKPVFKDESHFRAYALKSLRYRAIDQYRRRATQKAYIGNPVHNIDLPQESSQEGFVTIMEAMDALPKRQKEIMLRTIEGQTDSEIAEAMDISPSTVRSHRRFAKEKLVNQFEEDLK